MAEKEDHRRVVRFSWEKIDMPCEWNDCTTVSVLIYSYIDHIENCHLSCLEEGDLHCHWRNCDAIVKSLPELRRHVLFHAFHTKIKCYGTNLQARKKLPNCSLGICNRNIIPELPEAFMCCWGKCQLNFENPEYFYRHVDSHVEASCSEEDGKAVYQCFWTGCNRTFANQHKIKDHARSHSQEKVIACSVCGGMFSSRTKLVDHLQRQIPITDTEPANVYVCEYCSKKLQTERLLRDHAKVHVSHYKCPCCDMTCPTPSSLNAHISYRHSDYKPLSCQYCDYQCKRANDLRKHVESHGSSPNFKCPVESCDYSTMSQYCFKNHITSNHKEESSAKYACHVCSKVTTRGNYLTRHLREKHNFCWPSGHCRFRYRLHDDGFYRLQTVRYESTDLTEAVFSDRQKDENVIIGNPGILGVQNEAVVLQNETVVQSASIQSDSPLPTSEVVNLSVSPSATGLPIMLCVTNEAGIPSGASVPVQATVSDVVLVSPGNEPQPLSLQYVDEEGKQVLLSQGACLVLKTTDANNS